MWNYVKDACRRGSRILHNANANHLKAPSRIRYTKKFYMKFKDYREVHVPKLVRLKPFRGLPSYLLVLAYPWMVFKAAIYFDVYEDEEDKVQVRD